MSDTSPGEITLLLRRAREEQSSALDALLPHVHEELRRIAALQMQRERGDHTLDPTALVNEAYVRLVDQRDADWKDRAHFLAVAALAMRRVLVDHARARRASKREADRTRVTLHPDLASAEAAAVDLFDLSEQLDALRGLHERKARVVELRFFGGLTFEEAGHVLGLSPKTIEADWYFARAWLKRALRAGEPDAD